MHVQVFRLEPNGRQKFVIEGIAPETPVEGSSFIVWQRLEEEVHRRLSTSPVQEAVAVTLDGRKQWRLHTENNIYVVIENV